MYWFILALIVYSDGTEIVMISDIMPLLKCEWDLDVLWESLLVVNLYLFGAIG